jgi:hypothetical protein
LDSSEKFDSTLGFSESLGFSETLHWSDSKKFDSTLDFSESLEFSETLHWSNSERFGSSLDLSESIGFSETTHLSNSESLEDKSFATNNEKSDLPKDLSGTAATFPKEISFVSDKSPDSAYPNTFLETPNPEAKSASHFSQAVVESHKQTIGLSAVTVGEVDTSSSAPVFSQPHSSPNSGKPESQANPVSPLPGNSQAAPPISNEANEVVDSAKGTALPNSTGRKSSSSLPKVSEFPQVTNTTTMEEWGGDGGAGNAKKDGGKGRYPWGYVAAIAVAFVFDAVFATRLFYVHSRLRKKEKERMIKEISAKSKEHKPSSSLTTGGTKVTISSDICP